ncbi:hypothetical protein VNO77_22709 [Canavalia gladiata]|uniref:Uncharacterized protein n=1 Tax=Canavalia gladiata TaxID=3824 RepID=A0AAN9L5P8_CANGL
MDIRYAFREDRRRRSAGQRAQLKSQGVWGSRFRPTRGQSRRSLEHRTVPSISSTRSLPRRPEPKSQQLLKEAMTGHRTDRHLPLFRTGRRLSAKAFVRALEKRFAAWDQLRRHPTFSSRRTKLGSPFYNGDARLTRSRAQSYAKEMQELASANRKRRVQARPPRGSSVGKVASDGGHKVHGAICGKLDKGPSVACRGEEEEPSFAKSINSLKFFKIANRSL